MKGDQSEIYLYILKLEGGKYYVGITNNVVARYLKHLKGKGAAFTQKYKPVRLDRIYKFEGMDRKEVGCYETYVALNIAKVKGIDLVAGGGFTNVDDYERTISIVKLLANGQFIAHGRILPIESKEYNEKLKANRIFEFKEISIEAINFSLAP